MKSELSCDTNAGKSNESYLWKGKFQGLPESQRKLFSGFLGLVSLLFSVKI